ncbi:putative anion-transporting ATPase [Gordonia effusa NBRC 100432]|uniref:Putative anion-transporting ATPase n=1 Tax=Gordonia effusa NBRC 100432 TaxID=1077974 RepID=H0R2R2_9ACTN|nr:putative anion-transporting ATPase [Gordonia effusa NBRC 100432]
MVAAAAAVGPRSRGRSASDNTLLITCDRHSQTAARFGVYSKSSVPVEISSNLSLLELDPLAVTEQTWGEFAQALATAQSHSGPILPVVSALAAIAPGELISLPGIEDLLLMRRVRDEATSGRWTSVIVDCSGQRDPLALLRAPAVLSQALNRLWPRHRRLAAASERPMMARLTAAVDHLDGDCRDIAALLADPHTTAAHLVVGAGSRSTTVLTAQMASAALMGLPVRAIFDNSGSVDDAARMSAVAGDAVDVVTVPKVVGPLDRSVRLRKLNITLPAPGGRPTGSAAARVDLVSGSDLDAIYEMSWHQPLPEPDRLGLGRSDDDLLVTISGFRYPVRLPSVLRRCVVTDAAWDGGVLRIRFTPNPAVWPQKKSAPARKNRRSDD